MQSRDKQVRTLSTLTAFAVGSSTRLTEILTVVMQRASATMQLLLLLLHVRAVKDASRRLTAMLAVLADAQLSRCKKIEERPAAAAWVHCRSPTGHEQHAIQLANSSNDDVMTQFLLHWFLVVPPASPKDLEVDSKAYGPVSKLWAHDLLRKS
jgi:hypothetical protein